MVISFVVMLMMWHPETQGWEKIVVQTIEAPAMEICEEVIKEMEPFSIEAEDGHKLVMIYQCAQAI